MATCGTALGEKHFELLSRFAQRAVLAFDSDEAGARAAERAFAFQERYPVQAVVMIMPEGWIRRSSWRNTGRTRCARRRRPPDRWSSTWSAGPVDRHELSTVEGQSAAVADALPILQGLQDPVRRSQYTHLLADLAGVSDESVRTSLDRRLGGHPEQVEKTMRKASARDRVEREMLRLLVRDQAVFDEYAPQLTDEHVRTPAGRAPSRGAPRGRRRRRDAGRRRRPEGRGGGQRPRRGTVGGRSVARLCGARVRPPAGVRPQGNERRDPHPLQKKNPQTDPDYDELFHELVKVDGELRRIRDEMLGT